MLDFENDCEFKHRPKRNNLNGEFTFVGSVTVLRLLVDYFGCNHKYSIWLTKIVESNQIWNWEKLKKIQLYIYKTTKHKVSIKMYVVV